MKNKYLITLLAATLSVAAVFTSCNKEDTPTLSDVPSITSALVGISPTEVEVSGTLLSDGGSPITEWGVCWSTKPVPTTADHNVTAPVKGNSFNVVLTGLEPASIYYLRSYMITAKGTTYGNELSVVSKDQELTQKVVPDDVFRALLIARYDKNEDGILMVSEVSKLISLDVNDTKIASLEGIRYFHQLQELTCYSSKLTALDVSDLVNLKKIDCRDNLITTLDVSGCTELIKIDCNSNKLTSIEISSCKKLQTLTCIDNQMSTIDVSALVNLEKLLCRNNLLTAIDLSNCKKLTDVDLDDNKLSTIDVSMLADLDEISCNKNPLTSLNVSGCTKLSKIRVNTCKFTFLDVSSCVELRGLYCDDNPFISFDVSKCTKLTTLSCNNNQLSRLDVNMLPMLEWLYCNNNLLTSLDVSACAKLERLYCQDNQLSSLDVSACAELQLLSCQRNTNLNTISVSEQQNARKDAQGNIPGWEKPDQASYAPVDQILF